MNTWTLEGKKTVITGGTKGIGLAITKEFLGLGAEVLVVARDTKTSDLPQSNKLHRLDGDVTVPGFHNLILQRVRETWGELDVLVNNVGTNIRKKFVEYTDEEIRKLFEINLFHMTALTQGAFEFLKKSGKGCVVNIASVAGSFDTQTGPPYGMTKAGMIQLTRHLAAEWAPFNIRVNSVSPWFIQTPLTENLLAQPGRIEQIVARTPLGRVGKPEEICGIAAFLAMDKASYITGQNILIDGGMSTKGL
ncbi:MAG TPA: SDR family oxidoreductase [Cyclobacteriaceae bacterium]|nr:SDR family oxidoreductase [Cyclobacteriaceae bacterium]